MAWIQISPRVERRGGEGRGGGDATAKDRGVEVFGPWRGVLLEVSFVVVEGAVLAPFLQGLRVSNHLGVEVV